MNTHTHVDVVALVFVGLLLGPAESNVTLQVTDFHHVWIKRNMCYGMGNGCCWWPGPFVVWHFARCDDVAYARHVFLFISVKPNERLTKLTNTLRFISYCCCFLFMKWVQPNTKKPKQSPIFRQYSIVWTGQQAEVWWCMVHSPLVCSLYFFFLAQLLFFRAEQRTPIIVEKWIFGSMENPEGISTCHAIGYKSETNLRWKWRCSELNELSVSVSVQPNCYASSSSSCFCFYFARVAS